MKLGLVVNPVAGMGGSVGLKGTDGPARLAEARARGATPQAAQRVARALARAVSRVPNLALTVASGAMGADVAQALGLSAAVVRIDSGVSDGAATQAAVRAMADCDVIVFAGGDGTARDVMVALRDGQQMLGIPCGVKMHSGVFTVSPEAAGQVIAALAAGDAPAHWATAEVMDIDEDALAAGRVSPRLFGHVQVPVVGRAMQSAKGGPRRDWAAMLEGAARDILHEMAPGTLYLIGPGTSAGAVVRAAGGVPTLLGVDAMRDGRVVGLDLTCSDIERLAADGPVALVLGVTGQQGFLLGRGNQQIGPDIIRRAGRSGLIVLATEPKLAALTRPELLVDTGDAALDAALSGYIRVRTGVGRSMMMRIALAI